MILFIDNYDSFTYNLVHLFERAGGVGIDVVRNDAFDVERVIQRRPSAIVISPGPGVPSRAGKIVDLIRAAGSIPLLGVCLGHQAIAEALGGRVVPASVPRHGKVDRIRHQGGGLLADCPDPLEAVRYHSLVAERSSLPSELTVDAATEDGVVMAMSHRTRPLFGLQFHPESHGSSEGLRIARNFLVLGNQWGARCAPLRSGEGAEP
ncbi:MAG TPA: aminodeoxychorismate/anthranilate synthase component II [Thermoanaerobaculia bacterium]|nr:aminodeoxychorismate/anthranilate synthase component II [Thermoanaerobaculia bacterium]